MIPVKVQCKVLSPSLNRSVPTPDKSYWTITTWPDNLLSELCTKIARDALHCFC